ncbi:globoside alpha-1,3-N-acetylgalactosaminyltransferase 1 isoform X3 [Hylobates moloch]|uniref:globoside alpha-1,3-N-acetylgalactosaminyltransferase 1 isoform X3 n=1 Tax=Hylobates moloch TaxID=81572 RepID=UPI0013639E59|nr:globoside alpha-1,3-N-acetylgalactosaminyltransferase 1 isoform X3 [Hylobates moloch]
MQPPAMHRWRLALGLGFCLLVGTSLSVLWVYLENWLPVSYVPYYLPCPEIFNMKLHYKREKPLQPVVWSQYPQPKLLEHRWIIVPSSLEAGGADERYCNICTVLALRRCSGHCS